MITHPNTKINLGLNVLRKRPDGYHDIQTVFVPYFGMGDTLEIVRGDDYSRTSSSLIARYGPKKIAQGITQDGKCMITIARAEGVDWDPLADLCVKAYETLAAEFSLPPVKIFLEKTAPVGAGLGGGSADAAFALRMLSEMFSLGLDDNALAEHAARLGSDCAFFIWNRPMLGCGRGEILSPVEIPQLSSYELKVTIPPGIHVSTAEAYSGIVPRESAAAEAYGGIVPRESDFPLLEVLARPVTEWRELLKNDFEPTVFALHPQLAAFKQSLYDSGAVYASMSGSGSALYGLFLKSPTAEINPSLQKFV